MPSKNFPVANVSGYEISSFGRVRSHKKFQGNSLPKLRKPQRFRGGHVKIIAYGGREKPVHLNVHRLVIEAFSPTAADIPYCRHVDGDHGNNHIRNLRWSTHMENMRDIIDHGIMSYGEERPNSKLSNDDAAEIRCRREAGERGADLAREFKVSQVVICDIYKGRTWRNVQ